MKKGILFIIWFLSCLSQINGQTEINLLAPASTTPYAKFNDLLNFQINHAEPAGLPVYIQIGLEEQTTGLVSTLRSEQVQLNRGINNGIQLVGINGSNLNLVFARSGFERILDISFNFPNGKYNYCVEVRGEENQIIAKACSAFEQQKPESFFLIYPFNREEIEDELVNFNWTPYPTTDAGDLTYSIRWIETDQRINNTKDFFTTNEFFHIDDVSNNILIYRPTFPKFDRSKFYYWQVEARDGLRRLARSEIWEYSFKNKKLVTSNNTYVRLDQSSMDHIHYFKGDFLNFVWENKYGPGDFDFEIQNQEGRKVDLLMTEGSTKVVNGENYFSLAVGNEILLEQPYLLTVRGKTKAFKIKFLKTSK